MDRKKVKFVVLYFLIIFTCLANGIGNNKDFDLFNTAMSLDYPESYDSAIDILNSIKTDFSESILVESGTIDFNIGKIFFKQKKYNEAIEVFNLSKCKSTEKKYYIADSYYLMKNDKAFKIFKEIYENTDDTKYKVLALNKIANYDYYYSYYYEVKYLKNFANLWELNTSDLEEISDYFLEIKDLKNAKLLLEKLVNRTNDDMINAKYAFSTNRTEKALEILNKMDSTKSNALKVLIYKYLKNPSKEKYSMVKVIKKEPKSDLAAQYRYRLYQSEKNDNYLKWILVYNSKSKEYHKALELYGKEYISNFDKRELKYKSIIEKLNYLKENHLNNLCLLEIKKSELLKDDQIFRDYLVAIYK